MRLKKIVRLLAGSLVLVVVLAYLGLVVLMYQNQNRLVYTPSYTLATTPLSGGLAYEDVWLDTEDGERLHGWYIPSEPANGTVLFFHGNGGNVSHYLDRAGLYHRLGWNTLLFDYRGYGQSSGTPSEAGIYQDAAAAWAELVERRGIPPERIVVAGYSLGGAVAVWTATTYHPRALILESTFTSLPDVGAEHYPLLPVGLILRDHYPTLERMASLRVPVLILHSRDDRLIPFQQGQQLYAAAPEPKTLVELHGGHAEGFAESQAVIEDEIGAFLAGLSSSSPDAPAAP